MKKRKKSFLQRIGPGFITGAADDDPSGIGTYSQTGAQFGYSQLWLAFFSTPFMTVVQEMCGRIGMVTGRGLSSVIRSKFPKGILLFCVTLLFLANTVNIGADIGAMASAAQLLFGLPTWFWLFAMCGLMLGLQIFVPYRIYSRILKWLGLSLFAYIIAAFMVKQPWTQIVVSTFVPSFSFTTAYFMNIVAVLGTTISPYLFFWQADEEVEEEITKHKIFDFDFGKPRVTKEDRRGLWLDTLVGMIFSNLVMFFIIVTAASTLGANGITNISTAVEAAEVLKPLAGPFASIIFTLGIVGIGLLAVPVLAGSASYAICEAFHWRQGLSQTYRDAPAFYSVIAFATLIGLTVNLMGVPPFTMLYYSAVLNGAIAPILLVFILLIANDKRIMGKHVNSRISNVLGWGIMGLMSVAALAMFFFLIRG